MTDPKPIGHPPSLAALAPRPEMQQFVEAAQKLVEAAQADHLVSIDTICADIESLHKRQRKGLTVDDKMKITNILYQC